MPPLRQMRLQAKMCIRDRPTAPVPAYKSSHVDSASAAGSPAHSTLNSVSRTRSAVGRISRPGNDRSVRRRYCPAITLISSGSLNRYNSCAIPGPQGLEPESIAARSGTAEAVPFLKPFRRNGLSSRKTRQAASLREIQLSAQPFRFAFSQLRSINRCLTR